MTKVAQSSLFYIAPTGILAQNKFGPSESQYNSFQYISPTIFGSGRI
jgi:hypothetical protein